MIKPDEIRQNENFLYIVRDNRNGSSFIVLDKYIGNEKNILIPGVIDGNKVMMIGNRCFEGCDNITSIEFLSNNTNSYDGWDEHNIYIESKAFRNCKNLESLLFDIKKRHDLFIKDDAFEGCINLKSIVFPERWHSRSEINFINKCPNLEHCTISDKDKVYFYKILKNNKNIKLITLYNKEGRTEYNLENFKQVALSLSVVPSLDHYDWLLSKRMFKDIDELETITIPKYYVINERAFQNCRNLKCVNFEGSRITKINYKAFKGCSKLEEFKTPKKVELIEKEAFCNCKKLKSFIASNNLIEIDSEAFSGCISLESIVLPEKLETLGGGAFKGCTSLKSITIPKNIKSIGKDAFKNCSNLTIYFEGSNSMWNAVFKGDSSKLKIVCEEDNQNKVEN